MTQLTPVDGNPFASKSGPKLASVNYDPFAKAAPSFDGGAALRSVFPQARITSQHRGPGGVGPSDDYHHTTNAAVDLEPIKGMNFGQFTAKLQEAGYPIIQGIDEVNHPSKYATGPHWHVVLGARKGGPRLAEVDHDPFAGGGGNLVPVSGDPFKSPQKRSGAPRSPNTSKRPNPAQRAGNQAAEPSWRDLPGNIVPSAEKTAKGLFEAIRHPADTLKGVVETVGGAGLSAMDALSHRLEGKDFATGPKAKAMVARFKDEARPYLQHPFKQLKKDLIEDPVGTALTAAPVAGGAARVGKLGLRGVDAARLASLSPEARVALKAKRIEDMASSKAYKEMARPRMAQHRLDAERATNELRDHQKTIGNLPPEEQRKIAIAADTGDRTGIAAEHHGALDTIRSVAKRYEKKIRDVYAAGGHNLPEFVENYYKHWWHPSTTQGEIDEFLRKRQGSSASLKHRTIPTLAEGIEAGLKPRYENPLDTMTHYVHQISNHLVNHDLMNAMRKDPRIGAKWVSKRSIPDGYRKLEGIGTERGGRGISKEIDGQQIHTGNAPPMVLVAKDGAARLYNRRISKGLSETINEHFGATAGKAAKAVQRGGHALVSTKLFSAFHPILITGKGYASEIGNGIRHLSRGAPIDTIKSLAHMPFAPAVQVYQGAKMGKRLLEDEGKAMKEIDHLYVKAGGSVKSGDAYSTVDAPSHLESALRGTFATDMKKSLAQMGKSPVGGTIRMAGRALDSYNDTIFRHYIPAVKRGAFERELTTSLKAHPEWGEAEKAAEAKRVFSSIEGRMGVMTRDNMFWSNMAHDVGQVIFLSPSWQLGNARLVKQAMAEVPESIRSMLKGKGITQGPAQAMGLLGSYMLGNGVIQYLYTGQPPKDAHDLLAARTGGTNKDGTPERVMMPSVMKELYEYATSPLSELPNVINPSTKAGFQLVNNRDWSDTPIYHPQDAPWQPGDLSRPHEIANYLGDLATPIPFGQNPNGAQSHVGALGQFLGLRPAGKRFANPEGYEAQQRYFQGKDMDRLRRKERKRK